MTKFLSFAFVFLATISAGLAAPQKRQCQATLDTALVGHYSLACLQGPPSNLLHIECSSEVAISLLQLTYGPIYWRFALDRRRTYSYP